MLERVGAIFSLLFWSWLLFLGPIYGSFYGKPPYQVERISSQQQADASNKIDEHTNQNTNPANPAVPIQPSQGTEEDRANSQRQGEEAKQNGFWGEFWRVNLTDSLLALFTFFLVIFNALLAAYTYKLWRSTHKLWETGKKQIKIAETAADAARKSADVAEQAMIASNRSWVFTQPWIKDAEFDGEGNILFLMEIRLYGNMPALVTDIHIESAVELPSEEPIYSLDKCFDMTLGLAPGNRVWQDHPMGGPFKTPLSQPFIFGFVRYTNRFGEFYSRYCIKLKPLDGGKYTAQTAGSPAWSSHT